MREGEEVRVLQGARDGGWRESVHYISCAMEMIRKGGKGRSEVDAKRVTVENGARRLITESASIWKARNGRGTVDGGERRAKMMY